MIIQRIEEAHQKRKISRMILEALRDWFEVDESREGYINDSAEQIFFAALDGEQPVGFLCLKETGKATVELSVMGVLKEHHRQGIGRELFTCAKSYAKSAGYSFLQVKTVQMGHYEDYDRTNLFYLSLGFKEFEVLPTLWDELNPCQVYVMGL